MLENNSQTRRAFIRDGALFLMAAGASPVWADDSAILRIGLVTDLHSADKPPAGTRHYRDTPAKLAEAGRQFAKDQVDFVVELGDLIDAAPTVEEELRFLKAINAEFIAIDVDRHYVLGNHCVDTLTKAEFLGEVKQEKSYYSFDRKGFHFVILDACFRSDGEPYGRKNSKWTDANIPQAELDWLAADLKASGRKTIVFAHQRLDVGTDHGVRNAPAVRTILEASGQVLAVFQGHSHQNDFKVIEGIPYCTLVAMVEGAGPENSGYSTLQIQTDGSLRLAGFRNQKSQDWPLKE
jgi:predicted phosphodiesterase